MASLIVGLGVALALEPWPTAIAMAVLAVGIPGVVLFWRYPEFGIVLIVLLGSRILHPELLDLRLPIGGGLELPDLMLLGLVGLSISKLMFRSGSHLPTSRLLGPYSVLLAMALFSTLRALLLFGVEASWSFSELRGIVYLLVLLLATWELRQREQITRLFVGLFLVALFTVGIMIAQQFLGNIPLVSGQETPGWQIIDIGRGDITRIRPPAHMLLFYLSIVAFALMAFSQSNSQRRAMFALTVFLNLVLLLTFTRAQWLASIIAILTCIVFMPKKAKLVLASIALVIVSLGSFLILSNQSSALRAIEENRFVGPLMERVQSIFSGDEVLESYSLQARQFETRAAGDSIARNPILGVGLGNAYRPIAPWESLNRYYRFSRFMENSYLYIATKMGLPAVAILGWFIATIVAITYRGFKSARDPTLKGLSLASLAAIIGVLFWGVTHPVLFLPEHTLTVGLIGGIGEAVWRISR